MRQSEVKIHDRIKYLKNLREGHGPTTFREYTKRINELKWVLGLEPFFYI